MELKLEGFLLAFRTMLKVQLLAIALLVTANTKLYRMLTTAWICCDILLHCIHEQ